MTTNFELIYKIRTEKVSEVIADPTFINFVNFSKRQHDFENT